MVLAIYGTGGGGKETLHISQDIQNSDQRWEKIVFIDDTKPIGDFWGYVCYPYNDFKKIYSYQDTKIHVALGELHSKKVLIQKVKQDGYRLEKIVHPHAHIANSAELGEGVQVKMGSYIGENSRIGIGTWVQAYAIIGDNTMVGNYSQISAKVTLGNNLRIKDSVFIGMHATIANNITIGEGAMISMGAVVFDDVPESCVCGGNPGRIMLTNSIR